MANRCDANKCTEINAGVTSLDDNGVTVHDLISLRDGNVLWLKHVTCSEAKDKKSGLICQNTKDAEESKIVVYEAPHTKHEALVNTQMLIRPSTTASYRIGCKASDSEHTMFMKQQS